VWGGTWLTLAFTCKKGAYKKFSDRGGLRPLIHSSSCSELSGSDVDIEFFSIKLLVELRHLGSEDTLCSSVKYHNQLLKGASARQLSVFRQPSFCGAYLCNRVSSVDEFK